MIRPGDIQCANENLARRIISVGRSIAPCLDTLEGEPLADAIAILSGVASELMAGGPRRVKSQRIGPAAVEYYDVEAFSDEDKAALRALCSIAVPSGAPVGQFPAPARTIDHLWPEYRENC